MADTVKAILLVADISGYTKFMRDHTISVSHAKQIVVRLLRSLMGASKPPLVVAELEGDAVFFYALSTGKDVSTVAEQVKAQVVQLFTTFASEIEQINKVTTCTCDACQQVVDLKLKQVIHIGEVAIEKIAQFEKLFGIDVILVHRMLKNSVPSREYVMMTEPLFSSMRDFFGLTPEKRMEHFEGVGDVDTVVFYPGGVIDQLRKDLPGTEPAAAKDKLSWRIRMFFVTLADLLRLKKFKGDFHNLPV